MSRAATFLLASTSLARRELVRFVRQPSRVASALGTPVLFWFLLGSGMGESFRAESGYSGAEGASFLEFFFPGALILTIVFASVFSSISIIQDRQQGFLQAVLVAPVPRTSIVAGKVLGSAILAVFQAALFLALAPLAGIALTVPSFALALGWLALVSVALSGLGFAFAWRIDSVQGYHGIMNLLLMPMWLLSGALFPPAGVHGWLVPVVRANPLTYAVEGLRSSLYLPEGGTGPFVSMPLSLLVTLAFGALTIGGATWAVGSRGPRS